MFKDPEGYFFVLKYNKLSLSVCLQTFSASMQRCYNGRIWPCLLKIYSFPLLLLFLVSFVSVPRMDFFFNNIF